MDSPERSRLDTLIDEALNYSRVSRLGNLTSNAAAEELMRVGESALPAIEDALRNRVLIPGANADHHRMLQRWS